MDVFRTLSVVAKSADERRVFLSVGEHRSAIAQCAQILGGVKTGCGKLPYGTCVNPFPHRSDRLRAIFNDSELKAIAQSGQLIEIKTVSEEMNRRHIANFRALFEHVPAVVQIYQSVRVAIGKHRRRACLDNGKRGGKGRYRARKHEIAGPASKRPERQLNRIQSAGDADGMGQSPIDAQRRFETLHRLAEDIPSAGPNRFHGLHHICARFGPLALKIVEKNHVIFPIKLRNSSYSRI